MNDFTVKLDMSAEHMRKIFGMHDAYVKKMERDFGVAIVDRNGQLAITGAEEMVRRAEESSGSLRSSPGEETKSRSRTWITQLH